ncbi:hypothetical protein TGDOM2_356380 [Toxoplasma gondii GAB2-2007-GAL-DOM2]|nr:hypothetical protein TGDOM2_356380 [Toxoplasma gondii GAB2-2007-GAL-DOM2]
MKNQRNTEYLEEDGAQLLYPQLQFAVASAMLGQFLRSYFAVAQEIRNSAGSHLSQTRRVLYTRKSSQRSRGLDTHKPSGTGTTLHLTFFRSRGTVTPHLESFAKPLQVKLNVSKSPSHVPCFHITAY